MISQKAMQHAEKCRFCWMCRHLCPIQHQTGKGIQIPVDPCALVLCNAGFCRESDGRASRSGNIDLIFQRLTLNLAIHLPGYRLGGEADSAGEYQSALRLQAIGCQGGCQSQGLSLGDVNFHRAEVRGGFVQPAAFQHQAAAT